MKGRHRGKKSWGKLLKRAFSPLPHYFHLKICFICSSASFRDCPQELRGLRGVLDAPADSPGTLCWQLMKKNLSGLGDIALSCWVSPLLSLHFVKLTGVFSLILRPFSTYPASHCVWCKLSAQLLPSPLCSVSGWYKLESLSGNQAIIDLVEAESPPDKIYKA